MAIPKIREQIEARVKDTGDTMTDNLIIKRNTYPGVALDALSTGTRTSLQAWDNSAVLVNFNVSGNTDNRRAIFIKNSSTATQVKNALTLRDWVNGTSTDYKIYGEHNKPTPADIGAATASHVHDQYYTSDINRTANTVLAAPNGSAGSASFRKLVAADIPDLSGTYLKLSGGTMTGPIGMNVGTGLSMAYESGKDTPWIYPKGATGYGIRYLEGTPDKMMISASGNNTTAGGADLCINGNGEGTVTIRGNTILHAGNYNSYSPTKTGGGASGTWRISISGNAATATSATKATQDGNGATIASTYLKLAGGTMTGVISKAGGSSSWINGRDKALVRLSSYSAYSAITSMKTTNGSWEIGVYTNDNMWFTYASDANYNSNTNTVTQIQMSPAGALIVGANTDYTTYKARNIAANTSPLTSGSSSLTNGYIYVQYE